MVKQNLISGQRQRPFMMQLALASGVIAQPELLKSQSFGNDFWTHDTGRKIKISMEKVVIGIKNYQSHPYERKPLSRSIMWEDGQARFAWYAAKLRKNQKQAKAGVVIIPSLINNADILDILPEEISFIRWLAAQGIDVFVLEWKNICEDREITDIDSILSVKLPRMLNRLKSEYTDAPLFGIGYCMGGTFLAAADIICPNVFKGLVFIATPWDFKAKAKGNFAETITSWAHGGGIARISHVNYMPTEWLQMIFAGVDPAIIVRKFTAFADMDMDGCDARLFVAVEDWLNGGGDLPVGVVRQAVNDWYLQNKPATGKWVVGGHKINPKKINKPTLSIIPCMDKIVPPDSAMALAVKIPDADILTTDCGHISMMVSKKAKNNVWQPLKGWILSSIN